MKRSRSKAAGARREVSALFMAADGWDKQNTEDRRQLETAEQAYIHRLCLDHYPALRRYAWSLGFRGEAVDDWLQETFLVAIRRIDVLKAQENPGAYLVRILRNVIGHELRRMKYAARLAKSDDRKTQKETAATQKNKRPK